MGLLDFLLGSKPPQAPQAPGGLLGQVPQAMSYKQYQMQEIEAGRQPLSMADWVKAQQAQPKK